MSSGVLLGILVWLWLAVALAGLLGRLIATGMDSPDPWDGRERRKAPR